MHPLPPPDGVPQDDRTPFPADDILTAADLMEDGSGSETLAPPAPQTLAEAGLSEAQVLYLLLKTLYQQGASPGTSSPTRSPCPS
jgi:hypothetical protein